MHLQWKDPHLYLFYLRVTMGTQHSSESELAIILPLMNDCSDDSKTNYYLIK